MKDFGRASLLLPEAIGEPGRRTFRLLVQSGTAAASLWLEKEQLAALTIAVRQVLERTATVGGEPDAGAEPTPAASFPEKPDIDFKIGRLGIGYDEEQRMVILFAYELGEENDASPAFSCRVSAGQCRTLAERAEKVISAGRPICPLCGGPIDPDGHLCPRRNGHEDQRISLE